PVTIPLSRVLDYARRHVTVVMEGQGADELLGGYVGNNWPALLCEYLKKGDIRRLKKEYQLYAKYYSITYTTKMFFRLLNNDLIERAYQFHSGLNKIFGDTLRNYDRIKDYPLDPPKFDQIMNSGLFKSHTGGLVNLLHYGDAISMSKSMESRLPFMDVRLVEFVFQLPFYFKIYNGLGKYIHRVSMRNVVPDYILENPIKFGFNTPLSKQFKSLTEGPNKVLLSEQCLDRGIFNVRGLKSIMEEHIQKKKNNSTILFRLLSTELWFRQFVDSHI
nr:asparagine synthase C-terminal domain-containing protein [Smithellaceae bacterium]